MAVAWRRLHRVPADDPLPWLYRTARNLVLGERRRAHRRGDLPDIAVHHEPVLIDSGLERALRALSDADREALLLVAWEDLTPKQAAAAVGITATAFRVRLLRARRRLQALLAADAPPFTRLDVEEA
jgi:DNA-directed RNA polymerase specialized sigma24 family protein